MHVVVVHYTCCIDSGIIMHVVVVHCCIDSGIIMHVVVVHYTCCIDSGIIMHVLVIELCTYYVAWSIYSTVYYVPLHFTPASSVWSSGQSRVPLSYSIHSNRFSSVPLHNRSLWSMSLTVLFAMVKLLRFRATTSAKDINT